MNRRHALAFVAIASALPASAQPKTTPVVVSADEECRVAVDGEEQGVVPAHGAKKLQLTPGEHVVSAVCAGERRWRQVLTVGDQQKVVNIQPVGAPPAPVAQPPAAPPTGAQQAAPAPAVPVASAPARVPAGARVYIAPMNGYETYLAGAIRTKAVPVTLVANREQADFVITGSSESKKPSAFNSLVTGQTGSEESSSITVTHVASGVIVYSHNSHKGESWHGKRSSAESLAKHFKNHIEGKE